MLNNTEYHEYKDAYTKLIDKGRRDRENMASEHEWELVSYETKYQIITKLKKELEQVK